MYKLHSITALLAEAREMHTNHDIRFKWIGVINSMIGEQLNSGSHSPGVMFYLWTARDVLENANPDVHTHSSVKTRLRIAEHFLDKAVIANDTRHATESMTWHSGFQELFNAPGAFNESETQYFVPPSEDMEEIPF